MTCPNCGESELLYRVVDYVSDGESWNEDAWECSRCHHVWKREEDEEGAA